MAHHLLAPGSTPVIGRMFEAADARALAAGDPSASASASTSASTSASASAGAAGEASHVLPFVADVPAFRPGASITVTRRLSLDEDLFLADHNFVHAPGVKPLADCFPVVPMTASLEIMAETAACLAPDYGLTGFENVTARRWIAVADDGALALRIEGTVESHDATERCARIAVQVYAGAHPVPAIEATLLFGAHYEAAAPLQPCAARSGTTLDAARLYAERHLFHGPRFQGLQGAIELGQYTASANLLVRPASDWFASQPQPQLLMDPALLDTVGQLLAVWAMQQGGMAFPIGLARFDLFGPTPPPGTLVTARLAVTGRQLSMLSADVEIGDGAGGMWLRISGWKAWHFNWAPQLLAFQRQPCQYLLSDRQALPAAPADNICQRLGTQRVAGFDVALLARHCLHASEMAQFAAKAALPQRQLEWLLGRVAAKDAARAWHARASGAGDYLHPASFAIETDGAGQPRIARWPAGLPPPCISIAHSHGQVVALASATPAGIDIERIAARDAHFLASFTSAAERRLLAPWSGAERDAWTTRLWCAKEVLGKRLGTGVTGAPQHFEAQALGADGRLRMRHSTSGFETAVVTLQDGEFVIAFDSPSDHT